MTPEQLKASVLQMAIQGKLVEQRSEEGSADKLIEHIRSVKNEKINKGELKAEKPLPEIKGEEIPFDIPDSWRWIRLGDYCEKVTDQVASGSFASLRDNVPSLKEPDYAIMVKTADFANGFSANLTYTTEHGYHFLENSNLFGGELILSNIGSIGKCFIVPNLGTKMTLAPNAIMLRLVDNSYRDFLYHFILSSQGYKELIEISSGTTMKKYNKTDLKNILLPVPPLEEQHRIVAKIEELLPYVDRYAEAYEKLEQLNAKFPEDMKKSILQYAIQGKLVEQRPEEGTAEELYKQIQDEKQRLIKEGKIKKEKPLADITEDEIPFDIPESWKWVRVCSVGVTQTGNTPKKSHPEYFGNYIPFLGPGDIQNGNVDYDNQGLSEEGKEYGRVTPADSVLQVCIGGSIGKCALVDREVTFNQQINSIYPLISDSKYVYYVLDSYYFKDYMKENSGGTATPIINRGLWDAIVIPLPPLQEQHRIVAKIEELLPYCDRLVK